MTHDQQLHSLSQLDHYEQIGREHYVSTGKYLSHGQYLYLLRKLVPYSQLMTGSATREQKELETHFHKQYGESGLPEDLFISEGRNVEIEKLPRYISIPKHKHQFLECAYVLSGSCIHIVNGREYLQNAGDFVAITNGTPHELRPSGDSLCLTVKVRSPVFQEMLVPNIAHFVCPIMMHCGEDTFIIRTLLSLMDQQECRLPYSDRLADLLFETLIVYIMQNYWDTVHYLITDPLKEGRLIEMINYMLENSQAITLRGLAEHFHFNESYLSNLFKQEVGVSFSALIKEYRLSQAAKLLQETSMDLSAVCDAVGYKDTTQFIRSFKDRYGTTPGKYRKQQN